MRPWCSRVSSGSSGRALGVAGFLRGSSCSSVCALYVTGFFCTRLVHPGAPWEAFQFVLMRLVGRWVRFVLPCSSVYALRVAGCFRVRLVRPGVPWVSVGSF